MRSVTPPRARVTFEDDDSGAVSPSISPGGAEPAKPDAVVPETLEADATIDVSRADWDCSPGLGGTLPLSLESSEKPAQYAQSSGGSGSRESDGAGAESEDDDSDDDDSLAAGCLLPTQRQDAIDSDDSDDSDNEENEDGEGERRDAPADREAPAGAEQPRGAAPSPAGERAAASSKQSTESPDTSAALVSTLSSLKELRQQISADDAAHQREEVDINQRIDELIAERASKQRRWDEREKDLKEQESSMVRRQNPPPPLAQPPLVSPHLTGALVLPADGGSAGEPGAAQAKARGGDAIAAREEAQD